MGGMVRHWINHSYTLLRSLVRRRSASHQDEKPNEGHDWKLTYVHPTCKLGDGELWRCRRCEHEEWGPEDIIPIVGKTCNQVLMERVLG